MFLIPSPADRSNPTYRRPEIATVQAALRFTVLGAVRAWRGGTEISLGSPQQRATLAALLLRDGAPAMPEELIDVVWGEEPPKAAAGTMRTYIYRLRRALEPDPANPTVIRSMSGGYSLSTQALDLQEFQQHLDRARTERRDGRLPEATAALRAGLSLWSGQPLTGVPGDHAENQRTRLNELRTSTLEDQLALEIELGRHREACAELTALVMEHPLRERLRELLMLALSRSGRRADALALFRQGRQLLADELGIDPGPALQAMHRRILAADPELSAPQSIAATPTAQDLIEAGKPAGPQQRRDGRTDLGDREDRTDRPDRDDQTAPARARAVVHQGRSALAGRTGRRHGGRPAGMFTTCRFPNPRTMP